MYNSISLCGPDEMDYSWKAYTEMDLLIFKRPQKSLMFEHLIFLFSGTAC